MHYNVRGKLVRSENAALSTQLAHRWVLGQIRQWPRDAAVLDLGCGKLRYAIPIARRVRSVVAVDSREQVDRIQTVAGKTTSVRHFAKSSRNIHAFSLDQNGWRRRRYDRILCANVLSAIPRMDVRRNVLETIRDLLRPDGVALILNQHRNSEFAKYAARDDVTRELDGYLIPAGATHARFYGIIDTESLRQHCESVSLHCRKIGVWDQTAYALVTTTADAQDEKLAAMLTPPSAVPSVQQAAG